MEEGSWDLVKQQFTNYFDIYFGFTLQNVIVIYLFICFILLNHKMMIWSCLGDDFILEGVELADAPN